VGKRAKHYFGGIVGADPLVSGTPRTSGVFNLGALSADNAFEAPSLDLNFDGQASSFTRATTSPTAAKANGDQLATDIVSCTRSTTATYMGSNGLIQTAAVNTPRVEYDASGNPLGLLVEEQRTNLYPGTTPSNTAAVTFTTNQGAAPDGTNTAIKATEDSALGEKNANTALFSVTSGTQYTASLYAKPAGRTGIRLLMPGAAFGNNNVATYDLQGNGSIIEWPGSDTPDATTITPAGNGWYRISITSTAASTASTFLQMVIDDDGTDTNTSYQGDGSSGLLIWGIQSEEGAGPTSYIPTTSGSVTRAADEITLATSAFGFEETTGSVLADVTIDHATGSYERVFEFGTSNTNTDRVFMFLDAANNNDIEARINTGGTANVAAENVIVASPTFPHTSKLAMSYAAGNYMTADDGALVSMTAGAYNPGGSKPQLRLGGHQQTSLTMNGHIRRFTYWPRALSDASLASYTGTNPPTIDLDRPTRRWGGMTGRSLVASTAAPTTASIDYLVVGGGGAGGSKHAGGGGGGGGVLSGTTTSVSDGASLDVTVGSGGVGSSSTGGTDGDDSVLDYGTTITALGGGRGGSEGFLGGQNGGSGGGGAGDTQSNRNLGGAGEAGPPRQGYDGGTGTGFAFSNRYGNGAGGGGAGSAGQSATNSDGGDGGDGVTSSITGSAAYYGGGGGGGYYSGGGAPGSGGQGGGGDGVSSNAGNNGQANTGGGGGGSGGTGGTARIGGSGGSGVVILRMPSSVTLTSSNITVPAPQTVGSGEHYYEFTSGSGTVQVNIAAASTNVPTTGVLTLAEHYQSKI
jgi:hypothetical protein